MTLPCVWHTDLFPRNIVVGIEANPIDPVIIGILDCEEAKLGRLDYLGEQGFLFFSFSFLFLNHHEVRGDGIVALARTLLQDGL